MNSISISYNNCEFALYQNRSLQIAIASSVALGALAVGIVTLCALSGCNVSIFHNITVLHKIGAELFMIGGAVAGGAWFAFNLHLNSKYQSPEILKIDLNVNEKFDGTNNKHPSLNFLQGQVDLNEKFDELEKAMPNACYSQDKGRFAILPVPNVVIEGLTPVVFLHSDWTKRGIRLIWVPRESGNLDREQFQSDDEFQKALQESNEFASKYPHKLEIADRQRGEIVDELDRLGYSFVPADYT